MDWWISRTDSQPTKKGDGALCCFCEIGALEGSDRPGNMRDTHSLKWMANRRKLTVPDFWILISDAEASFFGHFTRSDIGMEMAPKMRHP